MSAEPASWEAVYQSLAASQNTVALYPGARRHSDVAARCAPLFAWLKRSGVLLETSTELQMVNGVWLYARRVMQVQTDQATLIPYAKLTWIVIRE